MKKTRTLGTKMPLGQHLSTEAFDARKRRFSCRARLVAAFVRKAVLFAPDGEARRCRAPKNQDVPPTVRPSMRTVGMPTPPGTLCPSLPHLPNIGRASCGERVCQSV